MTCLFSAPPPCDQPSAMMSSVSEHPSTAEPRTPVSGRPKHGVPQGKVTAAKCSATNRHGQPCKAWAIVGGTVCRTHGGAAPQVREAARQRILDLVPLAVRTLDAIAGDPDQPAAARVRAAVEILDRGIGKALEEVRLLGADEATNAELDARIAAALDVRSTETNEVLLPAVITVHEAPSHTTPHTS